jgi:GNAT superfamily N-acetyltransferase
MPEIEIDQAVQNVPEVAKVYAVGYRIFHSVGVEDGRARCWGFRARLHDRGAGCTLGTKFTSHTQTLFLDGIMVNPPHERKGVGTALIVAAVLTTKPKRVTGSAETGHGAKLMAKVRPILERLGTPYVGPVPEFPTVKM